MDMLLYFSAFPRNFILQLTSFKFRLTCQTRLLETSCHLDRNYSCLDQWFVTMSLQIFHFVQHHDGLESSLVQKGKVEHAQLNVKGT